MAEVDLPSPTNSEAAAMPSERLKQKVLSLSQQCKTLRATLQERDAKSQFAIVQELLSLFLMVAK